MSVNNGEALAGNATYSHIHIFFASEGRQSQTAMAMASLGIWLFEPTLIDKRSLGCGMPSKTGNNVRRYYATIYNFLLFATFNVLCIGHSGNTAMQDG